MSADHPHHLNGSATTAQGGASLPHWPKTAKPRRVGILGWARLAHQASEGSGYNLSASDLATGLALSGHKVFYLASGRKFNLVPWAHVSKTETWRGIECYDLVNSPNLSPAAYNFARMERELSCPKQTSMVLAWIRHHGVEVVHIHSLEGFSLDLIPAIRAMGVPVIVTAHNYWYVCPQVDLMHREVSICIDYEGGKKCESCLRPRPASAVVVKRRFGQTIERFVGVGMTGVGRQGVDAVQDWWKVVRGKKTSPLPNDLPPTLDTGEPVDLTVNGEDRGLIPQVTFPGPEDRVRRKLAPSPIDQNERFLQSTHHREDTARNIYTRRRAEGVAALNHASFVTPPSDFVRKTMVAMGVEESRTRTVRLGQRHFDQIRRRAVRSPFYPMRPWDPKHSTRPLRFAYFGTMRPSKGMDVLAEAIVQLPKEIRQRCQFILRIGGWDWPVRKKLIEYPEVSFLGGYDVIHLVAAGGEYDVGILPHVWFENSPLVLLEHLHAGKFVISSRLGGPPEWVIEPPVDAASRVVTDERRYNGLMVPGGRADVLADAIRRTVVGEAPIPSPAEVHAATPNLQTYAGHVLEVASLYEEAIEQQHAKAAASTRRA